MNHRGRSATDCSHVGNGRGPEDRNAQTSEHEDKTWSSRGSEGHDWFGQEEEESQEGYIENQNSYLGYNGMGHHNNEGISGITKGKGKGKKGSGKGFGKLFQGYCNTCGMWSHKAIDCKSQGKGKDSTRWYHGNKGKGLSKGGTKRFTKGKGKRMNNCEQGQRRWPATSSFHDLLLLKQKTESSMTCRRRSNTVTSTRTQRQQQPVTRINSGKYQSSGFKLVPITTRKSCKCEVDLKH